MDPVNGADVPVAFIAGLVSFVSPCVLPLVPGYLSVITGVRVEEIDDTDWRRVLVPSLLFIASFSAVFILLGLTATALGERLRDNQDLLTDIGAVLLIVMGVLFIAATFVDRLNREWHIEALLSRAGRGGPVVAGAAFSIAWTPCTGPALGGILTLAGIQGEAAHGAFLLAVYSLGLAVPFLITALAFSRATTAFAVIKRHYRAIVAVGGGILIAMGVLILSGGFTELNVWAQELTSDLGLEPLSYTRRGERGVGADADLDRGPDRLGALDLLALALARADDPEAPGAELGVADQRQPADLLPAEALDLVRVHPHLRGRPRTARVVLVDRLRDRLEVLRLRAQALPLLSPRRPRSSARGRPRRTRLRGSPRARRRDGSGRARGSPCDACSISSSSASSKPSASPPPPSRTARCSSSWRCSRASSRSSISSIVLLRVRLAPGAATLAPADRL